MRFREPLEHHLQQPLDSMLSECANRVHVHTSFSIVLENPMDDGPILLELELELLEIRVRLEPQRNFRKRPVNLESRAITSPKNKSCQSQEKSIESWKEHTFKLCLENKVEFSHSKGSI